MPDPTDRAYFSQRARTEALRAIAADSPHVAAVHQELCLRYAARVAAAFVTAAVRRR